jgi:hypothetical protein
VSQCGHVFISFLSNMMRQAALLAKGEPLSSVAFDRHLRQPCP